MPTHTSRHVRLTGTSGVETTLWSWLVRGETPDWLQPTDPPFEGADTPDALETARTTTGHCKRAFEPTGTPPEEVAELLDRYRRAVLRRAAAPDRFQRFSILVEFADGQVDGIDLLAVFGPPTSPSVSSTLA